MSRPNVEIVLKGVEEEDLQDLLEDIARNMMRGQREGYFLEGTSQPVEWSIRDHIPPAEIDRRQRLAAAALLMGFDLPQNLTAAAGSMMESAAVCPGLTTGDIPQMGRGGRRHALEHARALIDEMLAEEPR